MQILFRWEVEKVDVIIPVDGTGKWIAPRTHIHSHIDGLYAWVVRHVDRQYMVAIILPAWADGNTEETCKGFVDSTRGAYLKGEVIIQTTNPGW